MKLQSIRLRVLPQHLGGPNNALNCRSLRSLDSQKLRFCLPVSLIVMHYRDNARMDASVEAKKSNRDPRNILGFIGIALGLIAFELERQTYVSKRELYLILCLLFSVLTAIDILVSLRTGKINFRGPVFDIQQQPIAFHLRLFISTVAFILSIFGVIFYANQI